MGGPDGGDGGRGGDVYLRVDDQLATLTPFQYQIHYRAGNGEDGQGRNRHGKDGETLYIDVPPGTVAYDEASGAMLADLVGDGDTALILKGGQGGLGNARFKSSTNQAPHIAELGEPGGEAWIRLELKILADVGLVGFPNAGKSTLLAAASAAKPKIAEYPFTTLEPVLGVVTVGGPAGESFVVADIPGLIEGAAEGVGLGLDFLRHIERTRMLLHVVDGSGGLEGHDPIADFDAITEELASYSEELVNKPTFIVINKLDLPETREYLDLLREEFGSRGERIFPISAVTGEGVPELMNAVEERLRDIPRPDRSVDRAERVYTLDEVDEDYWEAERLSAHHFEVRGTKIERTLRMTDFSLEEAAERFQRILERSGIAARLTELGIQPGDVVHIADSELVWEQDLLEAEQEAAAGRSGRRTKRQRLQDRFGDDRSNTT